MIAAVHENSNTAARYRLEVTGSNVRAIAPLSPCSASRACRTGR
ncbi:MAG: hypothetical protein ACLR4Z_00885 [Butyricicoccaceae bacterium]